MTTAIAAAPRGSSAMKFDRTPFQHLYPFTSHWLGRQGAQLHYVDEGSGPPLVCVHGNPTWSFHFRRVVQRFSATHRVIAVDHLGCGLSDVPDEQSYGYSLDDRVADLEAVLTTLDLRDVTLVAHDWGGMIALATTLRQPERIARLFLMNTAGFRLPASRTLPWQLRLIRSQRWLGRLLVQGANGFVRGATAYCAVTGLPPDVRAAYLAPYDNWPHRRAVLRFVQDIPLTPADPAYATIARVEAALPMLCSRPTLICWGLRDFIFQPWILDEWRRRIPSAEYVVHEQAGHYLIEDAPDSVLRALGRFLGDRDTNRAEGAA